MTKVHFSPDALQAERRKGFENEGLLNAYIYRPLALQCTMIAARLRATPNQLTLISSFFSLVAAGFFLTGNYKLMLWGLLPFHLGKILDCADGQLARLTKQGSALGAFLDPFLDRVVDIATLLALAIGYRAATGSEVAVWLVFAFVVAWFFGVYLEKESAGSQRNMDTLRGTTSTLPPMVRRLLKWDGGFSGLITTLAVVFNLIPWVIGLFVVVAVLPVPIQFKRLYGELRARG